MAVKLFREVVETYGGEQAMRDRIARFARQLKDHAKTENVPAPTETPLIDQLARTDGGADFEIIDPPSAPKPEPLPPAPEEPAPPPKPEPLPPQEPPRVPGTRSRDEFTKARNDKFAELTAVRRDYQYGGIQYNKIQISSDDRTIIDLLLHVIAAKDDPTYAIAWRVGTGLYVTLDSDDLKAILDRVRAHIQNGVNREQRAAQSILDCTTIAELNALDVRAIWKRAT